jgi:UDP-N-acetylmuramate--alanine ligase
VFGRVKRVHLVGIGGSGMSGIALVLANMGFSVSGSDVKSSEVTERLSQAGVRVAIGHDAANVSDAEVVVYSSAVASTNPELERARAQGIPVIRRAEMLAELMRMKFAIAIAGSHGKTTVTSLIAHVLERAGLDPTSVVGGRVLGTDSGGRLGRSEYLVAEADESDRSFLALYPAVAVVTNIEREHLDVYHDLADIKREFVRFVNRVPFYGSVVLCMDSPAVRQIRPRATRRTVTYGVENAADFQARDVQLYGLSSAFTVLFRGREVGRFMLPLAGIHNVANGLAAVAVANELGIDFPLCEQALRVFSGVHRRLEKRGEKNGIVLFDDYGHHPTEVRVTLAALRQAFPERRLVVAFQPHRYSRTKLLAGEFGPAFAAADLLVLAKVYAASEPEIPGVDATLIQHAVEACAPKPAVTYVPEPADIVDWLVGQVRPGDVVLTLGAGSIWTIGEQLLARL